MHPFTKLLVFTDLHLQEPGETIIGIDTAARLRHGLRHALAHHRDAERVVLMGDLTHHGRSRQYAHLKEVLRDVPLPISFMMGNHDNRDVFCREFPDAHLSSSGHLQEMVDLGDSVLVTLDTLEHGVTPRHSGKLCADRLTWLEQALVWAAGRPVLIAMHHPPVMTGFEGMDRIALAPEDSDRLRAILADYPALLHILCGHVHRTISGNWRGLPFTILKSPSHQQPMIFAGPRTDQSVDEPGAYGIVLAQADGFIIHSEDFAIAEQSNPTHDPYSG